MSTDNQKPDTPQAPEEDGQGWSAFSWRDVCGPAAAIGLAELDGKQPEDTQQVPESMTNVLFRHEH